MEDLSPRPPRVRQYSRKKSVHKGAKHAGLTLGSMALLLTAGWFADPASVKALMGDSPRLLAALPLVVGLAAAVQNYLKHRDK